MGVWATLWLVVLMVVLVLFAGLLIGGTVFGIADLRHLLQNLKREHDLHLDDAGDDSEGPS